MYALSDYLYSVIIAGVLLFIVLALKFRTEDASIEATQFRAAKISELSLVAALERDFNNIGSQRRDLELDPEDAFITFDEAGTPAQLEFMAQPDSASPAQAICYEWQPMPDGATVTLERGTVPLIQVVRKMGGCTGGTVDGQSQYTITEFDIDLLRADGATFTNLKGANADIQQIVIKLRTISPLGVSDGIEETRWENVFRPVNLWKRRDD